MRGSWCKTAICVIAILSLVSNVAQADPDSGKFWRSYVELETRGGDIWAGQGNLFVPLKQTEVNMLFADVRGNWTDVESAHGNFGLGFRQMLVFDWIFGVHGAYDIRHSEYGNSFQQAVLGVEMLNVDWGVRWNGYLADDEPQLIATENAASLIGNQLFIQQAAERAYSGHDFEVERRLWYRESPSDNSWHDWGTYHDMELWGALGVYNYDNDAAGFGQLTGPRARVELRIYDVPFAGPDSRLVLGGQYEEDDERGSVSQASLTLRIPFGRGTGRPRSRLRCLNRRMVAPIERSTDVISIMGLQNRERAAFVGNAAAIDNVFSVDANTANLAGEINNAGENSLVIADGSAGTLSVPGGVTLRDDQTLIGGGSSLLVRGIDSGSTAVFIAPGDRPTFDSQNTTTFVTANRSRLLGLDIRNTGNSISGISMNGVTNGSVQDVTIDVTGQDSVGIRVNDSQFRIGNATIYTHGQNGNGVVVSGASRGQLVDATIGTSNTNAKGVIVADTSFLALQNSRVFTSGASGSEGVVANDASQLSVQNSVITVTGPDTYGLVANPNPPNPTDELSVSVANTVINATSDGIVLGDNTFTSGTLNATIVNNAIQSPIGKNEIAAVTNGSAIGKLSIVGNAVDPLSGTIRLDEIAGDLFVSQAAPGTVATGVDALNNLPPTNVLTPGNAIEYNADPPTLPAP